MSRQDILHLIQNLHGIWNSCNLAAIPAVYASDFIAHMPKDREKSEFRGHSGVAEAIMRIRNGFADWHEHVEEFVIEGDRAVTRYVSTGTQTGPFLGLPASGKMVKIDEISIYRLEAGLVAEQWCLTDDLTLARQLGLLA